MKKCHTKACDNCFPFGGAFLREVSAEKTHSCGYGEGRLWDTLVISPCIAPSQLSASGNTELEHTAFSVSVAGTLSDCKSFMSWNDSCSEHLCALCLPSPPPLLEVCRRVRQCSGACHLPSSGPWCAGEREEIRRLRTSSLRFSAYSFRLWWCWVSALCVCVCTHACPLWDSRDVDKMALYC